MQPPDDVAAMIRLHVSPAVTDIGGMEHELDYDTPEIHCRRATLYAAAGFPLKVDDEVRQAAAAVVDLAEWAKQVPGLRTQQRCEGS